MRSIIPTGEFKRGYKKLRKQPFFNDEFEKEFEKIVDDLANDIPLDQKYRDHKLVNQKGNVRECHVAPDWLLIYSKDDEGLKLILIDTGTHSNLFK